MNNYIAPFADDTAIIASHGHGFHQHQMSLNHLQVKLTKTILQEFCLLLLLNNLQLPQAEHI